MKESQPYYLPWSHGCDVICSWKQETIVFSKFSRGQVVANARHRDADIEKRSSAAGLLHTATDTYMDLRRRISYIIRSPYH